MIRARWYKVLNDLWGNKTRTILIVLSIGVGLFAVGMIVSSQAILSTELAKSYATINPSSGTLRTNEPFDDDFVQSVRRMPEVQDAEGRRSFGVRFRVRSEGTGSQAEEWRNLQIFAIPDYANMGINKIRPVSGAWPPPEHELLVERAALQLMRAEVGDVVLIETPGRQVREMRISGLVHDLSQLPAPIDGTPYGYISFDTLEWMGEPRGYNELHFVARDGANKDEAQRVVNLVKDKAEKSGLTIPMSMTAEPGQVPLNDVLQAILLLLGVLGVLSLLLSAFLIVNTISALLAQQVRQVGVMKAIGARTRQIMGMYLVMVLIYGVIALLLSVPLGTLGARALSRYMASLFNFDLTAFDVPPQAIVLQVVIGLAVPVLASLVPILSGLRVTAAQAMNTLGLNNGQFGKGFIDRILTGARSGLLARAVSRPLLLSLRNTFRRKGRLALTLATLTLGGAIFIGVFSVRASMLRAMDDLMQLYQFDVWVVAARPHRVDQLEREALRVQGVTSASTWLQMPVRRVRPDDNESGTIYLFALKPESNLLKPVIVRGRWLLPDDGNAIVVNTNFLKDEPDVDIGSDIVLKVEGRKTTWRIVGVTLGMGAPMSFANYPYMARVTRDVGRASSVLVATERHDGEFQSQVAAAIEAQFKSVGIRVGSVFTIAAEMGEAVAMFDIIIILLLIMALLLAVVGGLGLMGTMSINVLERTREIGVIRAIGASDGAVVQGFIVEGVVIGVLSWLLAALLAYPLSSALSDAVAVALLQTTVTYVYSVEGMLLWLGVVTALSALASFLPAWNASRLTVREVLAYE